MYFLNSGSSVFIFFKTYLKTIFFSLIYWFILFQRCDCLPGTRSGLYDFALLCCVTFQVIQFFGFTDGSSEWKAIEGASWWCTCHFLPFSHPWLASTIICWFWSWSDFCLWHWHCLCTPAKSRRSWGVTMSEWFFWLFSLTRSALKPYE